MAKYLIFEPVHKAWILTGFALLSTAGSIYRIGSSVSMPAFHGTRFAAYPYVMEAVTLVVLVYWIASAPSKIEKTFIALWLCAWAITWFDSAYPPSLLLLTQYATALLWIFALLVAIRLTTTAVRQKKTTMAGNQGGFQ